MGLPVILFLLFCLFLLFTFVSGARAHPSVSPLVPSREETIQCSPFLFDSARAFKHEVHAHNA